MSIGRLVAVAIVGSVCTASLGAQTHTTLHSFNNDQGFPYAAVLEASDGKLYGTAPGGGRWGLGSVYVLTPDGVGGVTFSTLASFSGTGNEPALVGGALIEASDGFFYGTTRGGGDHRVGTVFRISIAGEFETVHSFADGTPRASLVEGPGGILYGTVAFGGAHGYGTVFRMELSGDGFEVLHDFTEQEGYPELHGLIRGSDGLLYGTAYDPLQGVVFSISTDGDWTLLHAFDGTDGGSPEGGLVEAEDGRFYGTTRSEGEFGAGNFYSVDANGDFQIIESFHPSAIGSPSALIEASDGKFYGASRQGGASGLGTVFRLASSGGLEIVHDFDGPHGDSPVAGVIEASDGYLYGATEVGGPSNYGVVYRIAPAGEFEMLHSFGSDGGNYPLCALIESPAGTFYGTTGIGGSHGQGTAFSSDASGQVSYLHDFTAEEGSHPEQGLLEATDDFFYGIARSGGALGVGSFFRTDEAGTVTVLHSFTPPEGGSPFFIVSGVDGSFYGSNWRSILRLETSGTVTPVHEVPAHPGFGYELDRVMQAADGRLFGTTFMGGAYGLGTIYRLQSDGSGFQTLHDFSAIEGAFPVGRLLEASDGKLYGSTDGGGLHGAGVLFRIDPSGQYELLHSFGTSGSGDAAAGATLIEASDGYLYGASASAGAFSLGTVFRLDKNGEETVLHSFANGPIDGASPYGELLQGSDGFLYGSTLAGGTYGGGTLYRLDPSATLPVLNISPTSGPAGGGDTIVITGEGFEPGASVRIGVFPANAAATLGASEIQVTTPVLDGGSLSHIAVINPDGTEGTLSQAWFADFGDVPQSDPAQAYVEKIFRAAITAGCGGGLYCRFADVTRAQMAVFMLRALLGNRYYPPPATGTMFGDVAADSFAAAWIEDLASRGITAGCGGGLYCPSQSIRRDQMAVFLLKTLLGASYEPPAATGTVFADVPADSFAADFIEDLATRGITGGCLENPLRYCPASPTNRAQMAIFLVKAFGLP